MVALINFVDRKVEGSWPSFFERIMAKITREEGKIIIIIESNNYLLANSLIMARERV